MTPERELRELFEVIRADIRTHRSVSAVVHLDQLEKLLAAAPTPTPLADVRLENRFKASLKKWWSIPPSGLIKELAEIAYNWYGERPTPTPAPPPPLASLRAPTFGWFHPGAPGDAFTKDEHYLRAYCVEGHWYVDIDKHLGHSGIANGATIDAAMDSAKEMLGHMRASLRAEEEEK